MNLDELMAVWKLQDTAPLHDVNKTLLQQALRQDEAKLQKARRRERWILYSASAFVLGLMALFHALMISARGRYVMTGWDYVMGIGGAAAALVAAGAMFVGHRAQARREQRFGGSLRDQVKRRIAQLDDVVTGARRSVLVFMLMGVIWPIAILHLGMRINHKSLGDVSWVPVALLILCFWSGARRLRRSVPEAIERKRQLEALLKELDGQ
jgi:peptidoglycan/LPS O-acetylase OafA/YrhL